MDLGWSAYSCGKKATVHRIIINKRTLHWIWDKSSEASDDKILNLKEGHSTLNQVQIYTAVNTVLYVQEFIASVLVCLNDDFCYDFTLKVCLYLVSLAVFQAILSVSNYPLSASLLTFLHAHLSLFIFHDSMNFIS